MKQYMVLAKTTYGRWMHLPLWDERGEDDADALVSYVVAKEVAADWTREHGQECRVVAVA